MSKKFLRVNWKTVNGAARTKKVLRLRSNDEGLFVCPVDVCMHTGFQSSRGLRKHIDSLHDWYYYFDTAPPIKREEVERDDIQLRKSTTQHIPSFSISEGIGLSFMKWLQAPLGADKKEKQAKLIATRAMKFLLNVMGNDMVPGSKACAEYIDCCLGSASAVINFMQTVTVEWGVKSSGALNYVKAMSDLLDFRKSQGVSEHVLRSFAVTEVYIRRGKDNLGKKKAMEYTRNLDMESLIAKDSWATLDELEKVIPYHARRFHDVYQRSKQKEATINDLAFASRFVATYLFIRAKCSRPMTYQYLTLSMVDKAKSNGGFVDQTEFKTAANYLFDTVIMSDEVLNILDMYITVIRPNMSPTCEYVIISNTGNQYNSYTTALTLLVQEAIGKYIHPTRLRQIVETESSEKLSPEEQQVLSHDQKHSSGVAQRSYKKKLSRDVARQGQECMTKILGPSRVSSTSELADILKETSVSMASIDENVIDASRNMLSDYTHVTPAVPATLTATPAPDSPVAGSSSVVNAEDPNNAKTIDEEVISAARNLLSDQVPEKNDDDVILTNTVEGVSPMTKASVMSSYATGSGSADSSTLVTTDRTSDLPSWPSPQVNIVEVKEEEEKMDKKLGRRTRDKVQFTQDEDKNLAVGVDKYGKGHWGKILNDKELQFNPCRRRDSLRMRYETAAWKRYYKKQSGKN